MRRFLVATLSVAVLSAGACSQGAETGSEEGKIRIGLALSLSGALADSGEPILQGAEMWVDEGNKILGKEVELVVKDDESLPETDAKLYEYLISVENVDLLLGPYGSGNSAAVTPITDRHNRFILMTGASAAEVFARSKTAVQLYTPQLHMPELPLRVASENGYETIAAAGVDNDYGTEILRGIELYADKFGMDVVHKELYEETTQDLSSTILKMKQADPDVVYVGAYIPDSILFMRQAKEQGLEPKMFVLGPTGPVTQQFVDALGPSAEYVFGTAQWHPNAAYPGVREFVSSFKRENGEVPNYLHATGYGALEVLKRIAEDAGSLDDAPLLDVAEKTEYDTMFGQYEVDEDGIQVSQRSVLTQIQGGEIMPVFPADRAKAKPIVVTPPWDEREG